jgi:hypothetical protein
MVGNAVPAVMAANLASALAKQQFDVKVPIPFTETINPISNGQDPSHGAS